MSAIDNTQDAIRQSRNDFNTSSDIPEEEHSTLDRERDREAELDNDPLPGFPTNVLPNKG